MPRKPKFTREEVLASAFAVAREKGFESVTAASVAANMGYTGSSLFTHFEGMDELKREVYRMAKRLLTDTLSGSLDYTPAFKEMGLRWIGFARQEPNLYRMLFAGSPYTQREDIMAEFGEIFVPMQQEIRREFGLSAADAAALISQCIIQANGIAGFIVNGYEGEFSDERVARCLSAACRGFVLLCRAGDGTLTPEYARRLAEDTGAMPVRKKESGTIPEGERT